MERRQLIGEQISRIEQERVKRLEQAPDAGPNAMVHLLARVTGIGIETAATLVREVLTRNLRDRRAVARYGGLTGAPNQSGSFNREKGRRTRKSLRGGNRTLGADGAPVRAYVSSE